MKRWRQQLPPVDPGVAYHCWGCARHFTKVDSDKPATRLVEFLCSDPECPANDIIKAPRS